ncbi:MAG: patatin-like phospholipase family protein [Holophagae bacterium]|jgi:predicted acylesterase/phospholipase RssA
MTRRALFMATGANRGSWYAGLMGPLQEAGIDFELMAGVSAGGIASAWFAAGDEAALVDSWRQADPYRVALHPALSIGRRRTVDHLIRTITLATMDVEAARTSSVEVKVAVARIVGRGFPLPRFELEVMGNRTARDRDHFGRMLRATGYVPWINGCRTAVEIDGERYMDGGLVNRTPLEIVPESVYDELWIAACSPSGIGELAQALVDHRRRERLVVVTPGSELPAGRWTMDWPTIERTIEMGRRDIRKAISKTRESDDDVVHGMDSNELAAALEH